MTEKQGRKRTFGELERRRSQQAGAVTGWRARYTGPDLMRHSRNFGDKMAAEAWLNAERLLIDRDLWTPPRDRERRARLAAQRGITFAEWAERSIAGKQLRPSTRYRYEQTLRRRVLPDLGDIPLRDLSRLDITNWYTKMRAQLAAEARAAQRKGEGRGAAFSAYQVLSSVLNDAVDHELLDTSPARVKGALRYDAVHEPVVLTPEQMWTLHELMPDYLAALVPLAATTGLRHGELRALRRRHLDLDDPARAVVQVRGTAANNRVRGRFNEIGEPKTKASRRDVAIPSFVVPILQAHLEKHAQPGDDGFVFVGRKGAVLHASVVESNWQTVRQQLGLDDLHIHDLRHTALTWAARSGATLAELMAIAGHKNPTIALRYQHIGDEERRHAIAEKVGAAFTDELSQRRARRATGVEGGVRSVGSGGRGGPEGAGTHTSDVTD
ncbi:site-specific integrase [Georgenia muralis]